MPLANALPLLAPLLAPAEECGLGLAVAAATAGAALQSSLPSASVAVEDALLRASLML